MRLFSYKEKPATPLRHGGKNLKKHMFQWKNLFVRRFLRKCKYSGIYIKTKENEESIYKMMKASSRGDKEASPYQEVLCKKGALRNFAKFTGKHLSESVFLM